MTVDITNTYRNGHYLRDVTRYEDHRPLLVVDDEDVSDWLIDDKDRLHHIWKQVEAKLPIGYLQAVCDITSGYADREGATAVVPAPWHPNALAYSTDKWVHAFHGWPRLGARGVLDIWSEQSIWLPKAVDQLCQQHAPHVDFYADKMFDVECYGRRFGHIRCHGEDMLIALLPQPQNCDETLWWGQPLVDQLKRWEQIAAAQHQRTLDEIMEIRADHPWRYGL